MNKTEGRKPEIVNLNSSRFNMVEKKSSILSNYTRVKSAIIDKKLNKTDIFNTRPLNSNFCSNKSTLNCANLTLGFIEYNKQKSKKNSSIYTKSSSNIESN